jgi:hypothetical protein
MYRTSIPYPFVQTEMKPIPGTDANDTGLARRYDNLDVICQLYDNNNLLWDLVINRDGRAGQQLAHTVGFVRHDATARNFPQPNSCWSVSSTFPAYTTIWSGYVQADMKPIPGRGANNTGVARPGDSLAILCLFLGSYDSYPQDWLLVLNTTGHAGQQWADTVGFVEPGATLLPLTARPLLCGPRTS